MSRSDRSTQATLCSCGAASKAVQTALLRNISPKKDYIIDNIKDILREGGLASGFCPAAVPSLQSSLTDGAIHTTFFPGNPPPLDLRPQNMLQFRKRRSHQKRSLELLPVARCRTAAPATKSSSAAVRIRRPPPPPSDMSANAAEQLV